MRIKKLSLQKPIPGAVHHFGGSSFSVSNHYDHFIRVHANSNGIPRYQLTEFLKVPGKSNFFLVTNYHKLYSGFVRWQTLASGEGMKFSVVVPQAITNA